MQIHTARRTLNLGKRTDMPHLRVCDALESVRSQHKGLQTHNVDQTKGWLCSLEAFNKTHFVCMRAHACVRACVLVHVGG